MINARKLLVFCFLLAMTCLAGSETVLLGVTATIFPLYDWTRQIGGDKVEVTQLIPPGVETHAYSPRPSDIIRLSGAEIFLYIGRHMEPWVPGILESIDNPGLQVVVLGDDLKREYAGKPAPHVHHQHAEDNDCPGCTAGHVHADEDPHVWLDPVLARQMVARIAGVLAEKAPRHREYFMLRALEYDGELQELDDEIRRTLADCRRRTILYAGHFAFGCFVRRYGLEHFSPYPGFSPNAALKPRAMAELARRVKESGAHAIFHEELVEPRVARVIAAETGARMLLLHGAHNVTPAELREGATYLSIMRANLENLAIGLECR